MRQGTPGFIGARLRQGREARGVPAIALAEIVGVTRSAMSQYEHGHQSPSPDTMRRITEALNLPVQWFLRPVAKRDDGPIFYRCMAAATKSARTRAQARYYWLKEIVLLVQQHIRMPPVQLPCFDVPDDPSKISQEMIEEFATDTRRFWGLKDGPISNVVWLLENRGCVVSRVEMHAATLDAFSEFDPTTKRPYVVLGSDKASAARSRFDAAHELAHLVLHRRIGPAALTQLESFNVLEDQAHRFAGAFLLPAESFSKEFYAPNLDSLRSMKERWRVLIAAMVMRASQLHLITEKQTRSLQSNLGRRKWRTREPLDDVLEPEHPRFLRKCFELLIERGIVPAVEIPLLVGLPPTDVEQLCGLERGYLRRAESSVSLSSDDVNADDSDEIIIQFPYRTKAQ